MGLRLQDPDHTESLMQMAMRYPIPGILSTCSNSILDPNNMTTLVDVFKKARVFHQYISYIKGSFQSDSVTYSG